MITYSSSPVGGIPTATVTDADYNGADTDPAMIVSVIRDRSLGPAVLFRPTNSALTAVSPKDAVELADWIKEQLA